jgi:hypothetical protein
LQQEFKYFKLREDGVLIYWGKVYVPNSGEMKNTMRRELHNVTYVGNPGYHKSIASVKNQCFCPK